jgi:N-acetyl-1-D-myo-inositol-2-amino-2-deoxy-alpha-D-glucopyranoside deacetylase
MSEPLTLMIVHAHPDDECISTGGIIPRYSAEGVRVVLVIATRGEEGEIVLPELDIPTVRAQFGRYRTAELEQSAIILGVSDLEILGYRDSGMVDTPSNTHPESTNMADPDEVAGRIVKLVRQYKPQVLISYNEVGGYGHPDHIACHKATVAAFDAAGDGHRYADAGAPWTPAKLYYTNSPRKPVLEAWERMREMGIPSPLDNPQFDISRFTVPDEQVTTRIPIGPYLPQKVASMRVHRSQIQPDRFMLAVPQDLHPEFFGNEYFTRVKSRVELPEQAEGEYEEDLFAGLR